MKQPIGKTIRILGLTLLVLATGCQGSKNGTPDAGGDGDDGPVHDPGHPGAPCWADSDCLFDGVCLRTLNGFPGGYCIIEDCQTDSCPEGSICFPFNDGVDRCLPACTDDSECRQDDGYHCDVDDTCWPAGGMVHPGGPCASDGHCMGGNNAACVLQLGFLDGYCLILNCDPACPEGSVCRQVMADGTSACTPQCETDEDCRLGYKCSIEPGGDWDHSCVPGCSVGACPDPFSCEETDLWSGHQCEDMTYVCSPDNTSGDCEPGSVCSDSGECVPFDCDDTILEPNEDDQQAQPLPAQDSPDMQICAADEDWFTFTPDQPGVIHQIGIAYNLASGDLEIELLDDQLEHIESAHLDRDDIIMGNSFDPVNNESFSLLAAAGSQAYFVRVYPEAEAVNNYTLQVRTVPYQDGPVCADLYSLEECRAQAADGSDDLSLLIPFPSGGPLDPFIGDGIFFEHGLTQSDYSAHLTSSARWGRRELIMLVRNAVYEVQQAYPGTTPLAVGDVGLSDGSTPGGHPNTTHDHGANVDIAYYILPEYQRQWGNIVYRHICCDAQFLFDYQCVDTDEDSPEYGTCAAGSELTHIVDIPRTALLLAKLATGNRLRAAGVDTKLRADLEAEYLRLKDDGVITQQEYDTVLAKTKTTEDDPSWIWHFHHMHISLCTLDCE